MSKKPATKRIQGQPSYRLANKQVEAYITEQGGHLAPVTFCQDGKAIQPYSIAPWATEKVAPDTPEILKALRGDFFCMPFGANESPYKKEKYPVHGETANNKWKFESLDTQDDRTCLHLSMNLKIRKGRVDKRISLVDGHNALYCQHVISGMSGPMSLGHHATLKFPEEPGSGRLSMSRFIYGQAHPQLTENPETGGYSILEPGYEFKRLDKVKQIDGQWADLSRYPARRGFEDLAQVLTDPKLDVGWTAVTFPKQRYVWFALKDPKVLTGTLMWHSNAGRHYAPWSGRHHSVLGLEELTSFFAYGLSDSAKRNHFNKLGIKTVHDMKPKRPLTVNYIMALAPIPSTFDRVKTLRTTSDSVTLTSESGKKVEAPIDTGFLHR